MYSVVLVMILRKIAGIPSLLIGWTTLRLVVGGQKARSQWQQFTCNVKASKTLARVDRVLSDVSKNKIVVLLPPRLVLWDYYGKPL